MTHESATSKILLVDDEPRNLLALEAVLQGEGRHLVRATSGQEALKYLLQEDFAVIVLDVLMPDMDGFELASLIRSRERSRHTPIIFLTAARKERPYVVKGYKLGAADYILKPFDPESLRSKVGVFVELSRKTDEVKRQAEQLAETTAFLNSILASTNNVAIAALDLDGVVQMWPEGARRLYGYAPEEMVGRRAVACLHPEEDVASGRLARFLERALQEGKAEGVFEQVRINGERFSASAEVVRRSNSQGVPVGYVAITQDITQRLRTEEVRLELAREQAARAEAEAQAAARAAEQERLAFLSEASRQLAASLDYEATLTGVARLAVPRFADWCAVDLLEPDGQVRQLAVAHQDPAKEELAREAQRRYPPDPDAPRGIFKVLRTGQPELYPDIPDALLREAARDAEHLALLRAVGFRSAIVVPLVARGRSLGVISFVTMESERRYGAADLALAEELARVCALAIDNALLYRDLQEAVRARDQFLSVASHELRNPVTGLKVTAQLLERTRERGALDGERLERSLTAMSAGTDRLARLTDDLLDVARLRTGRLEMRPRPLDFAGFVREVVERHRGHLTDRQTLELDVRDGCQLAADPDRLEQVLANLVTNAVKYSPEGGPIRVATRPEGGGVLLEVRDPGIGLPAGAAEAMFEPFGRAENAEARQIPGLGLGLHICRQIVELHGGRIWAESPGEGRGTTLRVWLPCGGT
jgi:PAS domain S-box-containing protein